MGLTDRRKKKGISKGFCEPPQKAHQGLPDRKQSVCALKRHGGGKFGQDRVGYYRSFEYFRKPLQQKTCETKAPPIGRWVRNQRALEEKDSPQLGGRQNQNSLTRTLLVTNKFSKQVGGGFAGEHTWEVSGQGNSTLGGLPFL